MNKQTKEFLDYLKNQKNYSKDTIKSYGYDLDLFFKFLFENNTLMDQVTVDLIDFFIRKERESGVTARSCKRRISCYKQFYKYMYKVGYIKNNPFEGVDTMKSEYHLPDVLYLEQVKKIFEENKKRKDFLMIRDETILELLFFTGVRVEELVNIEIQDINLAGRQIRIIGKGNKERVVPFSQECKKTIDEYMKKCRPVLLKKGKTFDKNLLLNNRGRRLTTRGVEYILKQIEQKTGVDNDLHPHLFRHSFATYLLNGGVELLEVKDLLGHESIATTAIYTHISEEQMKETFFGSHPRAKKNK